MEGLESLDWEMTGRSRFLGVSFGPRYRFPAGVFEYADSAAVLFWNLGLLRMRLWTLQNK